MAISSLDILTCKITIGDADPSNPMVIKNQIQLTEVLNIEINESYKRLIGTAKIVFPKGTVFKSTIIGNGTMEGKDASRITTEIMQDGVIIEKKSTQKAIDETTFKIGQRINIKLGYNGDLKNMFDGYITAYNSDSQFELQCENMAYKLKLKQAPKFETPLSGTKVNDVCGEKYGLLKDTGFELHSETKRFDIQIGKVKITDNFTVADVLNDWSKYKVLKVDPKFLAVTGKALGADEKFFEVTVRLNPEYDPADAGSKEFQTINATQISKKTHRLTGNTTATGANVKTKVDLSTYTVVPYMSPNMKINSDKLVEETIAYFKNYNLNGITGSVTLFGDFGLTTAVQVELIDDRNPSKNGVYLADEVSTSFGVNGYRQKITLPYRIKGKTTYGNSK